MTVLERAFEIAGSGAVENLDEIKNKLLCEGYSQQDLQQLKGLIVLRQLAGAITSPSSENTPRNSANAEIKD